MHIGFRSAVAAGLLMASAVFSPGASAATDLIPANMTLACAIKNYVLKDFYKQALPGNPVLKCTNGYTPSNVEIEGNLLEIYAFGTGPYPITYYGGSLRECNRLMPSGKACFTSNPFVPPQVERSICGFPAPVAYVLACDAYGCTSEAFSQACASRAPDLPGNTFYTTAASAFNVAGHLTNATDLGHQGFSSRFDLTENLNTAASIVSQGRVPILGLGGLLFEPSNGALQAQAAQDLDRAIAQYPTVFSAPGLSIEVMDEPFLNADPASLAFRIDQLNKGIALLRKALPAASLGVAVAPVWQVDPNMIPSVEAIAPGLDWMATDPYAFSLDAAALDGALQRAHEFAAYLDTRHPGLKRWLILQGFAPPAAPLPGAWTSAQLAIFQQFIAEMVEISKSRYHGTLVWGWSNGAELPDGYTGKNFPPALKAFYSSVLAGQAP